MLRLQGKVLSFSAHESCTYQKNISIILPYAGEAASKIDCALATLRALAGVVLLSLEWLRLRPQN